MVLKSHHSPTQPRGTEWEEPEDPESAKLDPGHGCAMNASRNLGWRVGAMRTFGFPTDDISATDQLCDRGQVTSPL